MSKQEKQARYGQKIQEARKEQRMTREELADRVGMGKTSDHPRIQNIVLMLKDQPEEVIAFAEKMVRLCINDLPREK